MIRITPPIIIGERLSLGAGWVLGDGRGFSAGSADWLVELDIGTRVGVGDIIAVAEAFVNPLGLVDAGFGKSVAVGVTLGIELPSVGVSVRVTTAKVDWAEDDKDCVDIIEELVDDTDDCVDEADELADDADDCVDETDELADDADDCVDVTDELDDEDERAVGLGPRVGTVCGLGSAPT